MNKFMPKYLLLVLLVVILLAGGYVVLGSKISSLPQPFRLPGQAVQNSTLSQDQVSRTTQPTSFPTPTLSTSDQDLDTDLTALERDLSELDSNDTSFVNELKGL